MNNEQRQINHCLEMIVKLEKCSQVYSKEVFKLLGKVIRRYEKSGYKVPAYYKNKYKELRG